MKKRGMPTIEDKAPPFVWPDGLRLDANRVIVPRQHGWTVCKTTDVPALDYARLEWDAKACEWSKVKERIDEG